MLSRKALPRRVENLVAFLSTAEKAVGIQGNRNSL